MRKYDTAIILAGGKSTRMGLDKEKIVLDEDYLIDRIINKLKAVFGEIIVVTSDLEFYKNRDVIALEDETKNIGPIAGIHVGLKHSSSQYAYVTACDMPNINYEFIKYQRKLIDKYSPDVIIPIVNGHYEKLAIFYSKDLVNKINKNIKANKLSLYKLIEAAKSEVISEDVLKKISPNLNIFMNLNTRDDLKCYKENL